MVNGGPGKQVNKLTPLAIRPGRPGRRLDEPFKVSPTEQTAEIPRRKADG